MKKILAINGSASENSSNLSILKCFSQLLGDSFEVKIIDDLSDLPPFRTALTARNTPEKVVQFREAIAAADGVIICTPEYVFSIPSGLKNVLEWCVSTTVFSKKPLGLITAAANGAKAYQELQLIMRTIEGLFTEETMLLVQGAKGKINAEGEIVNDDLKIKLGQLANAFVELVEQNRGK
ncbi:NAD(P)H-dependent oxidoreductase [Flammeovirgaceae bacterium SG7u.111]|nr:NAD(P)H-dependent oxidoreductase [Flammeovirgaceae bacterium SG7u.132]WPO37890.1 NAD(P)H-dependent oxidoreductase [Flammeovirgaceae bacterium SG7u.111]